MKNVAVRFKLSENIKTLVIRCLLQIPLILVYNRAFKGY